tara:strand:+ start:2107 stop:2325 length:219 start_codon:yes stop_codon:yes gene_type:complete
MEIFKNKSLKIAMTEKYTAITNGFTFMEKSTILTVSKILVGFSRYKTFKKRWRSNFRKHLIAHSNQLIIFYF